jgi:hypothetical protein
MMPYVAGDSVEITCEGRTLPGVIVLASGNSVSLVVVFEGILADHVGTMPILMTDDTTGETVIGGVEVSLKKLSRAAS